MKQLILGRDEVVGPWVCERTGGEWCSGRGRTIGLAENGQLIAGVLFEDYNGANMLMHQAIVSPRAISRLFLWAVFDYVFRQNGCRRVTGIIADTNFGARRLTEHLGFRHEATLKAAHQNGDLLVYVMWRDECRWLALGERYGWKESSTNPAGLRIVDSAAGTGEPRGRTSRSECRAVQHG